MFISRRHGETDNWDAEQRAAWHGIEAGRAECGHYRRRKRHRYVMRGFSRAARIPLAGWRIKLPDAAHGHEHQRRHGRRSYLVACQCSRRTPAADAAGPASYVHRAGFVCRHHRRFDSCRPAGRLCLRKGRDAGRRFDSRSFRLRRRFSVSSCGSTQSVAAALTPSKAGQAISNPISRA